MDGRIKSDKALLIELGGYAKVARLLNKSPQCVFNWSRRGIPARVKLEHQDIFLRKGKRNDK